MKVKGILVILKCLIHDFYMKRCIFCDSILTNRTRSKEHVIPKWILENLEPGFTYDHTGKWTTFPNKPEHIISVRNYSMLSSLLGGVCKSCNEGWMSTLEMEFKPIFIALYDEQGPLIITQSQGSIFARWAYKTAITTNYSVNYKKIIPIDQIHSFYSENDLPQNLKVDVAFCKEVGIHYLIGGNRLAIIPESYDRKKEFLDRSYVVTFQFDHLLIRLSWSPDAQIRVRNIPNKAIYRIHPLDLKEMMIQYIKDELFDNISHFHFFSTIFVEKSFDLKSSDIELYIQRLQKLRSDISF